MPGVVGVVFILLALFALNLLPTRYAAFTLILGAFALFVLEAKFATHGVLGIGGIVLLTLGGLLLVDGPIPELRVHLWTSLAISVPLGLITIFLMTIAIKARRNKIVPVRKGCWAQSEKPAPRSIPRQSLHHGRTYGMLTPSHGYTSAST